MTWVTTMSLIRMIVHPCRCKRRGTGQNRFTAWLTMVGSAVRTGAQGHRAFGTHSVPYVTVPKCKARYADSDWFQLISCGGRHSVCKSTPGGLDACMTWTGHSGHRFSLRSATSPCAGAVLGRSAPPLRGARQRPQCLDSVDELVMSTFQRLRAIAFSLMESTQRIRAASFLRNLANLERPGNHLAHRQAAGWWPTRSNLPRHGLIVVSAAIWLGCDPEPQNTERTSTSPVEIAAVPQEIR